MFGFIPANVDDNTTIFYGNNIALIDSAVTTLWQTWSKPAGVKFVRIMTIGAGGGGGGGSIGSGTQIGGGGGGSGGISIVTIPAVFLPDTLYVFVAPRRPGLINTDTAGVNNTYTAVCAGPSSASRFRICIAYSGGYGGPDGLGSAVVAGAGALVASISDMPLATSGKYELYAGVAGAVGANDAIAGDSVTPLSNSLLSGGAGGGGKSASTSSNGGNQTAAGILPLISGGITTSRNGGNGVWNWKPLCGNGGGGGYAPLPLGNGGEGGDGAYGCGGGGSGAGSMTYARGGAGGSGLVIISCW